MLDSAARPSSLFFSMKMKQELYLRKQITQNKCQKTHHKMTKTHYVSLVSQSNLIPSILFYALHISNQVKDPGQPCLDD